MARLAMQQPVYFAPLGSDDARRISRLQKKLFPRALTEPEEEIRQILKNTEAFTVCNFSFGLFEGTRMVGYVFAYVETESIFHQREEDVLYIKEIALLPGYQRFLRPLFLKLFAQWLAFTPGMSFEAHAQEDSLAKWQRMDRLFKYYGLALTVKEEERRKGRPSYKLLRLDVADSTIDLRQQPAALPTGGIRCRDGTTVTVVRDPRQWLGLRERWDDLLRETDDSNVFQSFEYLWQWWRYFGIWKDLRILVIRQDAALIGVVPFMMEYFPVFGRIARKMMFLTAPMEMNRPKLLFGRHQARCLPAMLDFLQATADSWDILDIDEQLDDDAHTDAIRTHLRDAGYLLAESETLCPYIQLDGTWERFLASRSRRMRSNINRLRRKLAIEGEIAVLRTDTWPELSGAMDTYCELEERSWKAEKHLNISDSKAHYAFYRALAESFGRSGDFQLRTLQCNERPVASTFGIARDGVFQSLKIAHDSAYDSLSPGTVLESYELENLFDGALQRYEFMGSFLANKLRWTSSICRTTNIHVYQRQARLMLFFFVFFVFKRHVKAILKQTGQFDKVDRFLSKLKHNPFPRY